MRRVLRDSCMMVLGIVGYRAYKKWVFYKTLRKAMRNMAKRAQAKKEEPDSP